MSWICVLTPLSVILRPDLRIIAAHIFSPPSARTGGNMGQHTTTSERMDELPVLIYWLKQMRVDVLIDTVLGPPHGNWDGLSYGEVALVFLTHIVMRCTHFLSPVEEG